MIALSKAIIDHTFDSIVNNNGSLIENNLESSIGIL